MNLLNGDFINYDGDTTIFESLEFPNLGRIDVTYETLPQTLDDDPHVVLAFDFPAERLILRDQATGNLFRIHEIRNTNDKK